MGTVQRIARLEGDDAFPSPIGKIRTHLAGRCPQVDEVVMGRSLHAVDAAAQIDRPPPRQVGDAGMMCIQRAVDLRRFTRLVRTEDIRQGEQRERRALPVAKHDILADRQ